MMGSAQAHYECVRVRNRVLQRPKIHRHSRVGDARPRRPDLPLRGHQRTGSQAARSRHAEDLPGFAPRHADHPRGSHSDADLLSRQVPEPAPDPGFVPTWPATSPFQAASIRAPDPAAPYSASRTGNLIMQQRSICARHHLRPAFHDSCAAEPLIAVHPLARAEADTPRPRQATRRSDDHLFGKQHRRAIHAKASSCEAPSSRPAEAAELTKAPHLNGQSACRSCSILRVSRASRRSPTPMVSRLSAPRNPKFQLRTARAETDIVTHSFNGFPTSTAAEFTRLLRERSATAGPYAAPTPARILASHPVAKTFLTTQSASADQLRDDALLRRQQLQVHQRRRAITIRALSTRSGCRREIPVKRATRCEWQGLSRERDCPAGRLGARALRVAGTGRGGRRSNRRHHPLPGRRPGRSSSWRNFRSPARSRTATR